MHCVMNEFYSTINIAKDRKSDTWIITTTDGEGFHRQLNVTSTQMNELVRKWEQIMTEPPK